MKERFEVYPRLIRPVKIENRKIIIENRKIISELTIEVLQPLPFVCSRFYGRNSYCMSNH